MTHILSAAPSLAYLVQLNAHHPTCQSQSSRMAGTALTPALWTSRRDFYFPSFYYKLLWNKAKPWRTAVDVDLRGWAHGPRAPGYLQTNIILKHTGQHSKHTHTHPLALGMLKWASAEQKEQCHTCFGIWYPSQMRSSHSCRLFVRSEQREWDTERDSRH